MIFVSVGTNEARFDRLLQAVARLQLEERLVIQHGHSTELDVANAEAVAFLPFEGMVESIRRARLVVTHAGVGSIMVVLANGKRPIVVPRRRSFGEAVDDHQLQLGRRFADAGLVTLVERPEQLGEALERASGGEEAAPTVGSASSLASDIGAFLEQAISLRPTAVRA